jgi:hypothetical protein
MLAVRVVRTAWVTEPLSVWVESPDVAVALLVPLILMMYAAAV